MKNRVLHGDCAQIIPRLKDGSVALVVTSPPYAQQRRRDYCGIDEKAYPAWTVRWMKALRPKLKEDASVVINLRPHVRDGCISDYVLRTRLALREAGWHEIEELIWFQPDKPPFGSNKRPRRAYESLHWFAPSNRPYADPFAAGHPIKGWGGLRSKNGIDASPIHRGHPDIAKRTIARITDVIRVATGTIDRNVDHTAMFPRGLVRPLMQMLSREGDLCLDPFLGSGTVALVARELARRYIGIEQKLEYVELARGRLKEERLRSKTKG